MRHFPLCTRDDLQEMLLEAEQRLQALDEARSVSPEAEARRLAERVRAVRWLELVRADLARFGGVVTEGRESLFSGRDRSLLLSLVSRLMKLRDEARGNERNQIDRELNALRRAVVAEIDLLGGFYSTPRECRCGEAHLDRPTYWKHRVATDGDQA